MRRISTRAVAAGVLLAALLVAGVLSYYASSAPDGLNRVAGDTGFASAETSSRTAEGPLAGYETAGVEHDRLSGGLAGVTGVLVVLLLAGGVTQLVRRRPRPADADHA